MRISNNREIQKDLLDDKQRRLLYGYLKKSELVKHNSNGCDGWVRASVVRHDSVDQQATPTPSMI
jgi:hypothetical protein